MRAGNNRVMRDNRVVYDLGILDKPPSSAIRFSHRWKRSVTGTSAGNNEALSLIFFHYQLNSLQGFSINRILINSGRGFERCIWILISGVLWILPISIQDFASKECVSSFNRDKWQLALVPSETQQINYVKVSFGWIFCLLLSNARITFPFWEKEIPAWYFSKKSWPNN